MNKIEEIFKSWKIAYNPNDSQFELAEKRLSICESCIFKSDSVMKHCTVCGCALKAKIYSPDIGACPKGYWDDIDKQHQTDTMGDTYDNLKK